MGGGTWGGSTENCTVENNIAKDFGGGVWGGVHEGLAVTNNSACNYPDAAAAAELSR